MHSSLMPDPRDFSVKRFPQPKTEDWLREQYAKVDWWLESAAHLSDKELSLLGNGWSGIVRPSGVAGSWGDPSEFEKDVLDALALIPPGYAELPVDPVVFNIVREIVLQMHKKYALDAESGRAQSESQSRKASKSRRAKDEGGDTVADLIRTLSREHRNEKPSEVWPHLKTSLEEWSGEAVMEIGAGDGRAYRYVPPNSNEDNVRPISYDWFRKLLRRG